MIVCNEVKQLAGDKYLPAGMIQNDDRLRALWWSNATASYMSEMPYTTGLDTKTQQDGIYNASKMTLNKQRKQTNGVTTTDDET